MTKAAMQGDVTIRQVFGDFFLQENTPWDASTPRMLGIEPVQVNWCHQGSNSTDIALIAQAEALAKSATVDGVCVASSDGDFACVADLLNENKKLFLVMAPLLASRKLVEVCDRYISLDGGYQPPNQIGLTSRQLWLLTNAVAMHKNKTGWAKLSAVATYLQCHSPKYAKNKWGYRTLTKLLNAVGCFDVKMDYDGQMRTRRKIRSNPASPPKSTPTTLPICKATNEE